MLKNYTFVDFVQCKPCLPAVAFVNKYPTIEAAWLACTRPDWMIWFLDKNYLMSEIQATEIGYTIILPQLQKVGLTFPCETRLDALVSAMVCPMVDQDSLKEKINTVRDLCNETLDPILGRTCLELNHVARLRLTGSTGFTLYHVLHPYCEREANIIRDVMGKIFE